MARARPTLLAGVALLLGLGAACAGQGLYLGAKAALAQVLLGHAWERTRLTGEAQRPWPWADSHPVARLRAPTLGIDRVILADSTPRTLAFGPGHVPGTARPGEPGVSLVSGHRDTHFRFLENLRAGDRLLIERPAATHAYRVDHVRVIDLAHDRLTLDAGADRLVLVTCYPFDNWTAGGTRRYLVYARRIPDQPQRLPHRDKGAPAAGLGLLTTR